jgi:hypothetical protein
MQEAPVMPKPSLNLFVVIAIVLVASSIDIAASVLLRHPPPAVGERLALALMPLPGNIALLVLAIRAIRRLDEFQRRVHFEAVALSFLSTGIAVFIYGYLQKAQIAGPLNAGLVWAFMLLFYVIGYFVAASHYR